MVKMIYLPNDYIHPKLTPGEEYIIESSMSLSFNGSPSEYCIRLNTNEVVWRKAYDFITIEEYRIRTINEIIN